MLRGRCLVDAGRYSCVDPRAQLYCTMLAMVGPWLQEAFRFEWDYILAMGSRDFPQIIK